MQKVVRVLGMLVAVWLITARVDAATVTIAWDPNSETDLSRYVVGYRTSPSGSETLVNVGLVTTWSLTTAAPGQTYYFRVYAENTSGLRSAPSNEVSALVPTTPPPPTGGGLALERARLSYAAVRSGSAITSMSPNQRVLVTQTVSNSVSWSASVTSGSSWLRVSPSGGTGTAPVTISIVPGSLNAGTYNGVVRIRPSGTTLNLNIAVQARVYNAGASGAPVGVIDTPQDGIVNVAGAVPVTGWAVDDVAVSRVDIYRDSVGGEAPGSQVFIGTAAFVAGSRPDVENAYPDAPLNYRSGWGFMVLTNMLPDQNTGRATGGNGPFAVHAYAIDAEGRTNYLGTKRFTANNTQSIRPFGSIDTPSQGGVASGSAYMVFGWAISPRATIPTNGSTIMAYVDGNPVGRPTYNNYRADIATMFPGYANSNGAVGYLPLNTTLLSNGTHTISWVVTDNQGNSQGIGSRFFTVQNGTSAMTAAAVDSSTITAGSHGASIGESVETVTSVPAEYAFVSVKKVASDDPTPQLVFPEWTGAISVHTQETEQVEVKLANQFDGGGGQYEGYVVTGEKLRPLPVGSSLNTATGDFKWQPGPGFVGSYEFVFIRTLEGGFKTRIPDNITIGPKKGDSDR
jgi:hypothetical protein